MSAVVAIKANGRFYIAADKMRKRLDFYWRVNDEFNFKIHRLKNGIIVGAVGPLSQSQKLYLNESWFNTPKGVAFDKKFIVTSILPKYTEVLRKFNLFESEEDDDPVVPRISASFIIANGEDAFLIDNTLGVFVIKDYAAICDDGQSGVFENLEYVLDKSDPEKYLVETFKKASETLSNILPEIIVIDTVNTEFRLHGGSK